MISLRIFLFVYLVDFMICASFKNPEGAFQLYSSKRKKFEFFIVFRKRKNLEIEQVIYASPFDRIFGRVLRYLNGGKS